MSKNTNARMTALETSVASLDAKFDLLLGRLSEQAVTPEAAAPEAAPKARKAKAPKAGKAKAGSTTAVRLTIPMGELRAALKAHKAAGAIRAGITAHDALKEGLMLADGTLPGGKPAKAPKAKAGKAPKAEKSEAEKAAAAAKREAEFRRFRGLQTALKEHKEAGAIAKGVTVKDAIAAGLMLADGSLPTGKAPKKGKKGKKAQAAVLEASKPARTTIAHSAPRRADGTLTPKSEWAMREALADSGKFDRHEIDAIVASQHA